MFNYTSLYSAVVTLVFSALVIYDILWVGDEYLHLDLTLWYYVSFFMPAVHIFIPLHWLFSWKHIDQVGPPISILIMVHVTALVGAFMHAGEWQYALLNYAYFVAYAEVLRYSMSDES